FTDTLAFGAGINASDIRLTYNGNNYYDLTLSINGTTDSVTLYDYFYYNSTKLDLITFADGTVWDRTTLESLPVTFTGTESSDSFNGSFVADAMYGMGGDDSLYGNDGNDSIDGGVGHDYLSGGTGNDVLMGGEAGYQQVFAGYYEDVYVEYDPHTGTGGYYESRPVYNSVFVEGNDTLSGGDGDDVLVGGVGNDYLDGGTGNDTYIFNLGDGQDLIIETYDSQLNLITTFSGYVQSGDEITDFNPFNNATLVDSYNLTGLTVGSVYHIETTGDFDTILKVVDQFGNVIAQDDDTVSGFLSALNFQAQAGLDYTVYVGGYNNTQGNYTANVSEFLSSNVVSLGSGINTTDISVTYYGDDGITLSVIGTNDSITLSNYFDNNYNMGISKITFADGTVWGFSEILQALQRPPVLTGSQAMLNNGFEDASYTLYANDLLQGFTDINGDVLSVINLQVVNGSGSLIDNQNGTYTFTPNTHFYGTVNLSYQVSDGHGGMTSAENSFLLDAINDAPIVNPNVVFDTQQVNENQAFSFSVAQDAFIDVDGDNLSYSAIQANGQALPTWLSFDATTRTFSGIPSFSDADSLNIKIVASDGSETAEQTFVLTVNNVNRAPTGSSNATLASVAKGAASYTLLASDLLQGFSDADGDTLMVANLTADHATVVNNNNGTYTLTLEANYDGTVALNYQVVDGQGGGAVANQHFMVVANTAGTDGADVIRGGLESDTYIVNHVRDVVIEADANGGIDTVQSSLSHNLGNNVENLVLVGSANLSGTGNSLDNVITGNDGNNRLLTGDGNDSLFGGAGGDTLNGGVGADVMYGG
ncbi:MAG TPA: cadherin-like domain-containing protein, partial [Agitococcus sp.]|nr:cadherin-like domain-containing protein [Agitococcus sp.]